MTNRLRNRIKDYIMSILDRDEIIRVFHDNEVHIVPAILNQYGRTADVYNECVHSLPLPREKGNLKLIDVLNETILKATNDTNRVIYIDEYSKGKFDELKIEMENFGYLFQESKFIKRQVIEVKVESLSDEIKRLKTELKSGIGNLNSQDIIGKSKELLEATFKVICDKKGISYTKDDTFTNLMGKAVGSLELLTGVITEKDKSIKSLISIINGSSANINEIRNHHGSGHGKNGDYKPVDKQTAIFISNIALSITDYLESRIAKP